MSFAREMQAHMSQNATKSDCRPRITWNQPSNTPNSVPINRYRTNTITCWCIGRKSSQNWLNCDWEARGCASGFGERSKSKLSSLLTASRATNSPLHTKHHTRYVQLDKYYGILWKNRRKQPGMSKVTAVCVMKSWRSLTMPRLMPCNHRNCHRYPSENRHDNSTCLAEMTMGPKTVWNWRLGGKLWPFVWRNGMQCRAITFAVSHKLFLYLPITPPFRKWTHAFDSHSLCRNDPNKTHSKR